MTDAPANGTGHSHATTGSQPYRVLARKYRPSTFEDLIGQEAMVRTLSNAIASGRLAHAFVLTGVRGVGKTTTARIIARALNCVGPDGTGGPTIEPCGVCDNCVGIAEDRHVDVMEMDAASRTGVDDIRELIDGVRYRPVQARFKIYIIDEVHMLSKNAFNALLKTLEEPPEHVKFLFATTEIRRVPITVLSRCQRFDLRRIEFETLKDHLKKICEKEAVVVADDGLAAITRAAEGSVRDSLSMLDQAIAHGGGSHNHEVSGAQVREMLGLADRGRTADLFEAIMSGESEAALLDLREQYNTGADPLVTLSDLLEYSHLLTRVRAAPNAINEAADDVDLDRAKEMAGRLDMPSLTRAWQVLLKGLEEARMAPSAIAAAEMTLIRLAYASSLPSPADLIRKIQSSGSQTPVQSGGGGNGGGRHPSGGPGMSGSSEAIGTSSGGVASHSSHTGGQARAQVMSANGTYGSSHGMSGPQTHAEQSPHTAIHLQTFDDVVNLARQQRELMLSYNIKDHLHLVSFNAAQYRMEVRPSEKAPKELISELTTKLRKWTGQKWVITLSRSEGEATIHQKQETAQAALMQEAADHPIVAKVLALFPNAHIEYVEDLRHKESEADVFDASVPLGDVLEDDGDLAINSDDPFAYRDADGDL